VLILNSSVPLTAAEAYLNVTSAVDGPIATINGRGDLLLARGGLTISTRQRL
jgi:hypothetical protein